MWPNIMKNMNSMDFNLKCIFCRKHMFLSKEELKCVRIKENKTKF